MTMDFSRFEQRAPSRQTMADIFRGRWATDLGSVAGVDGTGGAALFGDPRIGMAAGALGVNGRFDDYRILELGPLEGAHSYQLEQLGARSVQAVEANTEAFLKCLVVKEMLNLSTRYFCGDVTLFMKASLDEYEMVFCCGILYHLEDPVELIKQICLHSNRCFVWTHFYNSASPELGGPRIPVPVEKNGFKTTYFERDYPSMDSPLFLGGNRPRHCWLEKDAIIAAFAHFGLAKATIFAEQTEYEFGAHFSCAFSR